jgi:hypothetical protein
MRLHLKRHKTLRNAGIATVLAGAALALTGCWANVVNYGNGYRDITVTRDMSANIIWNCTVSDGTGQPRALCALRTVGALCSGIPIKDISSSDCVRLESSEHWQYMDSAIQGVLGPHDCLVFYENPRSSEDYWTSADLGVRGCKK